MPSPPIKYMEMYMVLDPLVLKMDAKVVTFLSVIWDIIRVLPSSKT